MDEPIIISMFIAVVFIYTVSHLHPTTGIRPVDDFLLYIKAQKGAIANASIMVGIVTLFTQYYLDYSEPV
jgi:hypothetical protein